MAAYAALASLMNVIDRLQHHPYPPVSLDEQQVESLTKNVTFLQEFLEGNNSHAEEADPFEIRIADVARAAEAAIESYIAHVILLRGSIDQKFDFGEEIDVSGKEEEINCINLDESLQRVIEEMDLMKLEMGIGKEKRVPVQNQMERNVVKSTQKSTMVGFDDVSREIMNKLTARRRDRHVIPITGMGGIGKTTLARNIYEQPLIKEHFDIRAWATISQQYNTKEILCEVLSQANNESREGISSKMCEDEVGLALYKYLSGRRYLIVMDDMWNIEAWDKIQRFFPNDTNSRIVVTTRLSELGSQLDNNCSLAMKFLDEVSSWNLFSKIVFGEKSCPLELEEIGKKIVGDCRGLPLSIAVTGGLLEKLEHKKECWESIKKKLNSIVNLEDGERCLNILKMSYNHLPAYLKPCFLYLGVFEEDFEIRVSTLINLWVSEGFLKQTSGKSLETIAVEYLKDLVARNLVLVHELGSTGNIKYCKIHDLLRDLCWKEAQKEGFYDAIGQYSPDRCIRSRHCRVIPYRMTTPSQEYYFAKDHVFDIVNLRYFDICELKFPSFSNLLWNLCTLIISDVEGDGTITVEIWNLPQLRHVEFKREGICLPDPPSDNVIIMENLQTLKGVTNFKCSEEVVKRIPNIKKLGINYDEFDEHYYYLNNLERLRNLESLHCKIKSRATGYLITFPRSLKKLTLSVSSEFRLDDVLEKIGSLPLLQKFRLGGGCFERGEWEIVEGRFPCLKVLSLLWCQCLERWMLGGSGLPRLEKLHLVGIASLEEIPSEIGEISTLESIQLIYCSKGMVKSMKNIVEEQEELQGELPFHVQLTAFMADPAMNWPSPDFHIRRSSDFPDILINSTV